MNVRVVERNALNQAKEKQTKEKRAERGSKCGKRKGWKSSLVLQELAVPWRLKAQVSIVKSPIAGKADVQDGKSDKQFPQSTTSDDAKLRPPSHRKPAARLSAPRKLRLGIGS